MSRGFDPASDQWYCCCFRIITGSILLVLVQLLFSCYGLIRTILALSSGISKGIYWNHMALITTELSICALTIAACIWTVVGIQIRHRAWLVPYVALQVIRLFVYIALVISGKLIEDRSDVPEEDRVSLFVVSLIALVFLFVFEIYQGYTLIRCYRYICEELQVESDFRRFQMKETVYKTVHKETIRRERRQHELIKYQKKQQRPWFLGGKRWSLAGSSEPGSRRDSEMVKEERMSATIGEEA